ncbi:hypothetical protein BCV70DRAFT_207079 [Testicularia cyperi]|uniref:DUF4136 domain-containing protein n=1 Tax=Testicularia cyperi TaxID=1882483 RepID=A0A317XNM8_9BASI|nr:hypothetical protein BCV70DRAFT_207079 [Testicularia cyperi]
MTRFPLLSAVALLLLLLLELATAFEHEDRFDPFRTKVFAGVRGETEYIGNIQDRIEDRVRPTVEQEAVEYSKQRGFVYSHGGQRSGSEYLVSTTSPFDELGIELRIPAGDVGITYLKRTGNNWKLLSISHVKNPSPTLLSGIISGFRELRARK